MEQQIHSMLWWLIPVIIIASIWDSVWKAAQNKHLAWYICIFIFNTIGILPIIYILLYKEKSDTST
jgi:hypothetical protein